MLPVDIFAGVDVGPITKSFSLCNVETVNPL